MYELFFTFSNTGRYEFFYGILSFTRGDTAAALSDTAFINDIFSQLRATM